MAENLALFFYQVFSVLFTLMAALLLGFYIPYRIIASLVEVFGGGDSAKDT